MLITSLGTQLLVVDLDRSVRFYVDRLGFKEDFRFRDFYAGLKAGGTSVHLKRIDGLDPSIAFVQAGDHLHLYLRVTDLDAAYAELHGNVEIVYPITTKPWGDREFTIRDPDGHTIYIGQALPTHLLAPQASLGRLSTHRAKYVPPNMAFSWRTCRSASRSLWCPQLNAATLDGPMAIGSLT